MLPALVSILVSVVLLGVLARHDPKRLRNQSHPRAVGDLRLLPNSLRRSFAWLVPAPGLVLALAGQWWAFLVWLGASCTLGWVTAQLLAERVSRP